MNVRRIIVTSSLLLLAAVPLRAEECDKSCLADIARQYLQALLRQDYRSLPWTDTVGFTENDVAMMIGDGLWGTATGVSEDHLLVADRKTGNVFWMGVVEEHGLPAYLGLRIAVEDRKIDEVESIVGREGTPGSFASTDGYRVGAIFSEENAKKQSRRKLVKIVDNYYKSVEQNDGRVHAKFAADCVRRENGVFTTRGSEHWAAQVANGCRQQLALGLFKATDSIRNIRYPVVDEKAGVVVTFSLHDHAVRSTEYETLEGQKINVPVEYPNTLSMVEVFKIVDGEIKRIESYSAFQPYYISNKWEQ